MEETSKGFYTVPTRIIWRKSNGHESNWDKVKKGSAPVQGRIWVAVRIWILIPATDALTPKPLPPSHQVSPRLPQRSAQSCTAELAWVWRTRATDDTQPQHAPVRHGVTRTKDMFSLNVPLRCTLWTARIFLDVVNFEP